MPTQNQILTKRSEGAPWIALAIGAAVGGFVALMLYLMFTSWFWFLLFPPLSAWSFYRYAKPSSGKK